MTLSRFAIYSSTLVLASGIACGTLACEGLTSDRSGVVVGVPDGGTLVLATGEKVRLTGIQAPKLPMGGDTITGWPFAEAARDALVKLAEGQDVMLKFGGAGRDRHGRILAQAFLADGTWLQGALLARGLARVYTFPDNRACADALYAAERQARVDRKGIWAEPFYAIGDAARPGALLSRAGEFELVEGRVLNAARAGGMVYLNFGRRWKDDFTVTIDSVARKLFARAGLDPLSFEGALIRVRGWLEDGDGPRIAVSHPEQIEVLSWQ